MPAAPAPAPAHGNTIVEALFRREIAPWALLGFTMGLVEGATAAVLVKQGYTGVASAFAVNLATAFVSGAPAFSNVVSFAWANIAHGRARVRLMVWLQALFALSVGAIALAPRAGSGLAFAVVSILLARTLWTGILTIRSVVWSTNYPRNVLARVTGRLLVVSSLCVAASAALVGGVLDAGRFDTRWLYAAGAALGLAGAWLYRRMRVRREFQLLAEENAAFAAAEPFSLRMLGEILGRDPAYREYMFWMALFGAGNLMLISQLVIIFSEQLKLPGSTQIALLAIVPLVTWPIFVPVWARQFDGSHIVVYRARQAWVLVAAVAMFAVGVFTSWQPLLWIASVTYGIAMAGANLGWNLGHNDFASSGRAQHYMGVHVTLTGVRGLVAPPLGIVVYEALERIARGWGSVAVLLPLAMTLAGAVGFNRMRRAQLSGAPTGKYERT